MSVSSITFPPGSSIMCFNLSILPDLEVETGEVFEIQLAAQAGSSMLTVANAVAEVRVADLTSKKSIIP